MAKKSSRTDEEWISLIQECRNSGLTDRQWCIQNQMSFSTFYYHIKDLRKKACSLPEPVRKSSEQIHEVVPVRIIGENSFHQPDDSMSPAVRLQINGICMEIANNASSDIIKATLLALKQLC